jgi:phospholipid N-methyltransferase
MSLKQHARFLWEYVSKPAVVGAVCASSPALARKMVQWIDWPNVRAVVEYGPGTGAFTKQILSRMQPGTRLLAIEINPHFAATLRRRYPEVPVFQESVKNVPSICRQEGIDEVDAIVSGLPWASFRKADQVELLDATTRVLRPGGQFATFAYLQGLLLPAGRRLRGMLGECFSQVEISKIAWWNLPPAIVYRCRR